MSRKTRKRGTSAVAVRAEVRLAVQRADLHRAGERSALVRLRRGGRGGDRVTGYLVDVGRRWLLLARLGEGVALDGFVALRLDDVDKVTVIGDAGDGKATVTARMARRALQLRGCWPPEPPGTPVGLSSAGRILEDLAAAYPLVSVAGADQSPGTCVVGVPAGVTARNARLLQVDTRGRWWREVSRHRLKDITLIGFGGRYERALYEVAGPPPVPLLGFDLRRPYFDVLWVLNRFDPEGLLALGAPANEYQAEADDFARLLRRGDDLDADAVRGIWSEWFEDTTAFTPPEPRGTSTVAVRLADALREAGDAR